MKFFVPYSTYLNILYIKCLPKNKGPIEIIVLRSDANTTVVGLPQRSIPTQSRNQGLSQRTSSFMFN
jgi:hypothetical protein